MYTENYPEDVSIGVLKNKDYFLLLWANDYQQDIQRALTLVEEHSSLSANQLNNLREMLELIMEP